MKNPLVPLVLAAAVTQVLAGEAPTPGDRLVACIDVQESLARLACFDREILPFAKPKVASAPAPIPLPAPAPRAATPARSAAVPVAPAAAPAVAPSLGDEQLESTRRQRDQEEAPSLTARITALRETGGAYVVTLDNGQTWRHENQHLGSYLRQGEAVTIRKATLGSYRLTRDAGDSKDWIRVTRVR